MQIVIQTIKQHGRSNAEPLWMIRGLVVPHQIETGECERPYRIRYSLDEEDGDKGNASPLHDTGAFTIPLRGLPQSTTIRLSVDYLAPSRDRTSSTVIYTPYCYETEDIVLKTEENDVGEKTIRIVNTSGMTQLRGAELRNLLGKTKELEIVNEEGVMQFGNLFSEDGEATEKEAIQLNGRTRAGMILYSDLTLARTNGKSLHVHAWQKCSEGNSLPIRLGRGKIAKDVDCQTCYSPLVQGSLWKRYIKHWEKRQKAGKRVPSEHRQLMANVRSTWYVSRRAANLVCRASEHGGEYLACSVREGTRPVMVYASADPDSLLKTIEPGTEERLPDHHCVLRFGKDMEDRNGGVNLRCRILSDGEQEKRTLGAVILQLEDYQQFDARGPKEQHVWLRRGVILKDVGGKWEVVRPVEYQKKYAGAPPLTVTVDQQNGRLFLIGELFAGIQNSEATGSMRICCAQDMDLCYEDAGIRIDAKVHRFSPMEIDYRNADIPEE